MPEDFIKVIYTGRTKKEKSQTQLAKVGPEIKFLYIYIEFDPKCARLLPGVLALAA
jgi:hypothetical protein